MTEHLHFIEHRHEYMDRARFALDALLQEEE